MDARGPIDIATFGFALPRSTGGRSRSYVSPVLRNDGSGGVLIAGIIAASSLIVPAVILGVRLLGKR